MGTNPINGILIRHTPPEQSIHRKWRQPRPIPGRIPGSPGPPAPQTPGSALSIRRHTLNRPAAPNASLRAPQRGRAAS